MDEHGNSTQKTPESEQDKQCGNLGFKGNSSGHIKSETCGLGPRQEQSEIISRNGTGTLLKDQVQTDYLSLHRIL